jgi:hypothetical protein
MYATVRRYEGIDKVRSEEVTRKVGDSLLPRLRELPGFGGYYLIDAGGGVLTSVGLFESSAQAHESTRLAAQWVREQKLEGALPNTPKITAGDLLRVQQRGSHERGCRVRVKARAMFESGGAVRGPLDSSAQKPLRERPIETLFREAFHESTAAW